MGIKEQLEAINNVPRIKLARRLGINRQALYNWLQSEKNIEKIYDAATRIDEYIPDDDKEEIKYLRGIILELRNTNSKLIRENKQLQQELTNTIEYKELKQKYEQLKQRYYLQNDELKMLKAGKPIQRECM